MERLPICLGKARKLIENAYIKTKELLVEKRAELELVAQELLAKEVIYQVDLERLIGARPTGDTHLTEQIPQVISKEPIPEPEVVASEAPAADDAPEQA